MFSLYPSARYVEHMLIANLSIVLDCGPRNVVLSRTMGYLSGVDKTFIFIPQLMEPRQNWILVLFSIYILFNSHQIARSNSLM